MKNNLNKKEEKQEEDLLSLEVNPEELPGNSKLIKNNCFMSIFNNFSFENDLPNANIYHNDIWASVNNKNNFQKMIKVYNNYKKNKEDNLEILQPKTKINNFFENNEEEINSSCEFTRKTINIFNNNKKFIKDEDIFLHSKKLPGKMINFNEGQIRVKNAIKIQSIIRMYLVKEYLRKEKAKIIPKKNPEELFSQILLSKKEYTNKTQKKTINKKVELKSNEILSIQKENKKNIENLLKIIPKDEFSIINVFSKDKLKNLRIKESISNLSENNEKFTTKTLIGKKSPLKLNKLKSEELRDSVEIYTENLENSSSYEKFGQDKAARDKYSSGYIKESINYKETLQESINESIFEESAAKKIKFFIEEDIPMSSSDKRKKIEENNEENEYADEAFESISMEKKVKN